MVKERYLTQPHFKTLRALLRDCCFIVFAVSLFWVHSESECSDIYDLRVHQVTASQHASGGTLLARLWKKVKSLRPSVWRTSWLGGTEPLVGFASGFGMSMVLGAVSPGLNRSVFTIVSVWPSCDLQPWSRPSGWKLSGSNAFLPSQCKSSEYQWTPSWFWWEPVNPVQLWRILRGEKAQWARACCSTTA